MVPPGGVAGTDKHPASAQLVDKLCFVTGSLTGASDRPGQRRTLRFGPPAARTCLAFSPLSNRHTALTMLDQRPQPETLLGSAGHSMELRVPVAKIGFDLRTIRADQPADEMHVVEPRRRRPVAKRRPRPRRPRRPLQMKDFGHLTGDLSPLPICQLLTFGKREHDVIHLAFRRARPPKHRRPQRQLAAQRPAFVVIQCLTNRHLNVRRRRRHPLINMLIGASRTKQIVDNPG